MNTFKVTMPSEEDVKWVTDSLLARNPELFTNVAKNNKTKLANKTQMTPADIARVVICVYIGSCGNRFNTEKRE